MTLFEFKKYLDESVLVQMGQTVFEFEYGYELDSGDFELELIEHGTDEVKYKVRMNMRTARIMYDSIRAEFTIPNLRPIKLLGVKKVEPRMYNFIEMRLHPHMFNYHDYANIGAFIRRVLDMEREMLRDYSREEIRRAFKRQYEEWVGTWDEEWSKMI